MTIHEEVGWKYPIGSSGLMSLAVDGLNRALGLCSLGKLASDHVNLTYVMEKPPAAMTSLSVSNGTTCAMVNS